LSFVTDLCVSIRTKVYALNWQQQILECAAVVGRSGYLWWSNSDTGLKSRLAPPTRPFILQVALV